MNKSPLGLYVHIPFCSRICHYCDFAKTSNFNADHVTLYLQALHAHLRTWFEVLPKGQKFTSVFFGGGTPGLLTKQYEQLMGLVLDLTSPGAEITLESNPTNVTDENISIWKALGFNRLSVGVQSFNAAGLKTMTRDHSSSEAIKSLNLAALHFPKSNGDLIYGWPGQSISSWEDDIRQMIASGVNHMSLYALTYEGQTPFARAERRGAIRSATGDELAEFYDKACDVLRGHGYTHEEISNWSQAGGVCDHNWLYWRGQHFVGIGAGAHGFIDDGSDIGLRYSYPGDLRQFLRLAQIGGSYVDPLPSRVIRTTGGIIDGERDKQAWLFEYVGCALRSSEGIDLELLNEKGFVFYPNGKINRALNEGLLKISNQKMLAAESEWFRETAWSYEICSCIHSIRME